jgi:hypothetical protein
MEPPVQFGSPPVHDPDQLLVVPGDGCVFLEPDHGQVGKTHRARVRSAGALGGRVQ